MESLPKVLTPLCEDVYRSYVALVRSVPANYFNITFHNDTLYTVLQVLDLACKFIYTSGSFKSNVTLKNSSIVKIV
jgi:hypothetical protein